MVCLFYDKNIERMYRNYVYFSKKEDIFFVPVNNFDAVKRFCTAADAMLVYYNEDMDVEELFDSNAANILKLYIFGKEKDTVSQMVEYMFDATYICDNIESERMYEFLKNETNNIVGQMKKHKNNLDKLLKKCVIPVHLQGTEYLRYAVEKCCEDTEMIYGITKLLYPHLACKFGVRATSVEHAMRTAIEKIWKNNEHILCKMLRLKPGVRPTNKAFIYACVHYITDNYQNN